MSELKLSWGLRAKGDPPKGESTFMGGQIGVSFSVIEKDGGSTVNILGFDRQKFSTTLGV